MGASAAEALDDIWEGVALVITGLLESPNFVFRVELAEADPDDPTRGRYDSHAIATRIAYFLTNAPPDDELAALADAGMLTDSATLASQITRLLSLPSSSTARADFFRDWLRLERLDSLAKDSEIYPEASAELSAEMKEDLIRSVATIVGDGSADYRDLFTSDVAFAGAHLAEVYGVTGTDSIQQIRAPAEQERIGLLGKPGFLALYATSDRSSPTLRGKFVREAILCESVAAPPPEVATVVPEADESAPTMRDRLAKHRTGTCAACHNLMVPIGLTMEAFDGIGSYRTTENGVTLDLSGDIDGKEVTGLAELAELLVDDTRLTTCAARTMYRYAVAHVETSGEEATIASIVAQFTASQYTTKALMAAIASSDGFRFAALPASEAP